jgi:hypothetical protein
MDKDIKKIFGKKENLKDELNELIEKGYIRKVGDYYAI